MPPTALHRALTAPPPDGLALRPLPDRVAALLHTLNAPPRLAAHLRAVHDVAARLCDWAERVHPQLPFRRTAVLFGAATHDIGKTLHPAELSGPGSAHEEAGHALLLAHGVAPQLARFARTHASWTAPDTGVDDLLVSLADKIWKGKRVADLENLLVQRIAEAGGQQPWEAFLTLDDALDGLAANADHRLAFQSAYGTDVSACRTDGGA
ncbi:phosphohydrolase [Streptomyces sp. NPDC048483]|uniref:phosphohydrolase n=1 Tax=Streptomyces sp. NPDC048483 TaxID=3154927 RepID=UPI003439A507